MSRPFHRPKGSPNLREQEIITICNAVKKRMPNVRAGDYGMLRCYELAAQETGYDESTVGRVWRMMQPTTELATDFFKARAFRMAAKVVKDADPSLLVDILSRPNIGVLEPIKKQEGGMGGGFLVNVSADSLGAVSVAVGQLPAPQAQLPPPSTPLPAIEMEPVEPAKPIRERGFGKSEQFQKAVEAANKRLKKRAKWAETKRKQRAKHEAKQIP